MTDHTWMIDVLEDLELYAANNKLKSLYWLLCAARSKAENEIEANATARERTQVLLSTGRLN